MKKKTETRHPNSFFGLWKQIPENRRIGRRIRENVGDHIGADRRELSPEAQEFYDSHMYVNGPGRFLYKGAKPQDRDLEKLRKEITRLMPNHSDIAKRLLAELREIEEALGIPEEKTLQRTKKITLH